MKILFVICVLLLTSSCTCIACVFGDYSDFDFISDESPYSKFFNKTCQLNQPCILWKDPSANASQNIHFSLAKETTFGDTSELVKRLPLGTKIEITTFARQTMYSLYTVSLIHMLCAIDNQPEIVYQLDIHCDDLPFEIVRD